MSTTPRVLVVGNFLSMYSGTRSICEELSGWLIGKGWQVIETSNRIQRIPRLLDMVFTVISRRSDYDVASVDVFSDLSFVWAEIVSILLKSLQKRFILILHGGRLADFAKENPKRMARLLVRADKVVTPSMFLMGELSTIRPDIFYLPNALDLEQYPFHLRDQPAPNLVWLRAFHEIYQPSMAVDVLGMLAWEFPKIRLTMIGPDKKDGSLSRFLQDARRLGVESRISIVGPVSKQEVPSCLDAGDIFLNTTCVESFGVSVMEAAACGLPIVTTAAGELSFLWRDGHDALLISPRDAAGMAAAVKRVLTEPGLAARLSANARTKAENHTWSAILPIWEALFRDLENDA